jgi:hypothetical protein
VLKFLGFSNPIYTSPSTTFTFSSSASKQVSVSYLSRNAVMLNSCYPRIDPHFQGKAGQHTRAPADPHRMSESACPLDKEALLGRV